MRNVFVVALTLGLAGVAQAQVGRPAHRPTNLDPMARSYYRLGPANRTYRAPYTPQSGVLLHPDYYRGPGGNVVTRDGLPRDYVNRGYKYIGNGGTSTSTPIGRRR